MEGSKEANWIVKAAHKRRSQFSTAVLFETADPERIKDFEKLLFEQGYIDVFNMKKGGSVLPLTRLIYDPWEGLKQIELRDNVVVTTPLELNTDNEVDRTRAMLMGGGDGIFDLTQALRTAEGLMKTKPTVFIIKNIANKEQPLLQALRSWTDDGQILSQKSTVFIFAESASLILDDYTKKLTAIVPIPISTDEEREKIIRDLSSKMPNVEYQPHLIKVSAGLNLHDTEASLLESYFAERNFSVNQLTEFKTEMVKKTGILTFERAKFGFEAIGGYEETKRFIKEQIIALLENPDKVTSMGLELPRGILLFGPPGCITGEAVVCLATGHLVRIGELAREAPPGIYLADLPVFPNDAKATALHVYDVPETIEFTTRRGRRLRTTLNHPVMTDEGWKKAEELKVGSRIKVFNEIPSPSPSAYVKVGRTPVRAWSHKKRIVTTIPSILNEDLGELLGIFTAEGNADYWHPKFTINSNEDDLKNRITTLTKKIFGIEPRVKKLAFKNCLNIFIDSTEVQEFLSQFPKDKIAKEILLSPKTVSSAFLRGLFEGDGHTGHTSTSSVVALTSINKQLLEEVQVLLLRFNISSSIYRHSKRELGDTWRLTIVTKDNIQKFSNQIGFISERKKQRLSNLLSRYKRNSAPRITEYEEVIEINHIKKWERVYDFEVPSTHAFFSNGILSHNTGKTIIAQAIAYQLQLPFINFRLEDVLRGIVGESEQRLRTAIDLIEEISPAVVFIDEIDRLGQRNDVSTDSGVSRRIFSMLLEWLGKRDRKAILVATTNTPEQLDDAIMRPGRLDVKFPILYPDADARRDILRIHLDVVRKVPHEEIDYNKIVEKTRLWTGAELEDLVKRATRVAFIAGASVVGMPHIEEALRSFNVGKNRDKELKKQLALAQRFCDNLDFLKKVTAESGDIYSKADALLDEVESK